MENLSLRLRIFLFFALIGLGGVAIVVLSLMLGMRGVSDTGALSGFLQAGIIACFGIVFLSAGVWFLFDEHVSKPIEQLAARMRAGAHAGVSTEQGDLARYLGDLAPAATEVTKLLADAADSTAGAIALRTERLENEKARLTAMLTEIPLAMVLVNARHQIVLYDGQAAAVLAQIAPPRLNAPVTDYFDFAAIEQAWMELIRTGKDVSFTALGYEGEQTYDMRMQPLEKEGGYMLIIDAAKANIAPDAARPLVYDFALLEQNEGTPVDQRRLSDLVFVVFDTETTGLLPHKDDVVQIGAVRIINGQIVPGEEINTLVNPERPIPASSTKVHGVTDAMVVNAPRIEEAVTGFHRFTQQSVIVAHNAPFDMAFINRYGKKLGLSWDNPVLDTVLASAVVFGASETHTLDALSDRLGIEIPHSKRHTALGDAISTAQVLCRLIPMLEARGIETFGDLLVEMRKHGRILKDLN